MAVGAAVAVVGALVGLSGARKARRQARQAARVQARQEAVVTGAKVKQLAAEQDLAIGQQTAGYAGAGVDVNVGTPLDVFRETAQSYAAERRVVSEVGATKASLALQRGKMVGDSAMFNAYAKAASSLAQGFGVFISNSGSGSGSRFGTKTVTGVTGASGKG